jgi:hypothetical protein
MNGLELSEKYFTDACLPILRREAPEALERLAAGLVGEGSECFGWDDELSRDHSWGPRVCLFLTDADMREHGAAVARAVSLFPDSFMGLRVVPGSASEGKRAGLFSVGEFYTRLIGFPGVPQTNAEWLSIPEVRLAPAVNGRVFRDPVGDFSRIRDGLLGFYPDDVRRWLLAKHAALAAQTGQVNMVRCFLHGEVLAEKTVKYRFSEHAAAMVFLIEGCYRPFYKWLFRGLRELSPFGEAVYRGLCELSKASDIRAEQREAESVSALLIAELRSRGLSDSGSDFLMDHCGLLLRGIADEQLRSRPLPLDF